MKVKKWRCTVCDEMFDYDKKPATCPVCGVGQEMFELVEVEVSEKSIEKETDIIIIGGGVAAVNAADAISSRNKKARITIICKENYLPYYRTRLTELLDTDIPLERLEIKKESWYQDRNIKVILGQEVKSIDEKEKKVILGCKEQGIKFNSLDIDSESKCFVPVVENSTNVEEIKYDSLVIASGAKCFVPPFENKNLKNVRVIRELAETLDIKNNEKEYKNAVVIGGGVLGLEAAWGLKNVGIDVTVLEVMPKILPRQLDDKGSALLEEIIVAAGVKVEKGVQVKGFEGKDKVEKVVLNDGREFLADIVIISAGIAPNKDFILSCGIEANKGIVVNEKMETCVEDIYACGDIAEFNGKVIGLWQVAMEQGKIVGANICGEELVYKEQIQPLNFEGMNTCLLSVGDVHSDSLENDYVEEFDRDKKIYKKFVFSNGILKGAILIGDTAKSISIIRGVREGIRKSDILAKLYNN